MYLFRLDDASEFMNLEKWNQIEQLFRRYEVKPIFGIIPDNHDPSLLNLYQKNPFFWDLVNKWIQEGWIPALHGDTHEYVTKNGGVNPVNFRSEFAGLSLSEQQEKIRHGYSVLVNHGVYPSVFFAPSHTFDLLTLQALKNETPIRVISDTVASDVYFKNGFYFVPQQSGRIRRLPFRLVTFCYHPNEMTPQDFLELEKFLKKQRRKISVYSPDILKKRNYSVFDRFLSFAYFEKRKNKQGR